MVEQEEIELIKQCTALLKEQNALLKKQQDLLTRSIAETKAHTDWWLDKLEAHIIKNRKYLRHADEYLQDIARIRNEEEGIYDHKN